MAAASNLRVPELVAGVDVRSLPLSALEGFVLSRIDGRSSAGDIVSLTGLPLEQVDGILEKLIGLGAVRFRDEARFEAPSTARRDALGTGVHSTPPRRRPPSHTPSPHHRRVFSESGVSSPPPEMPPHHSARPRTSGESGAPSRTHTMPPNSQRAAPSMPAGTASVSQPPVTPSQVPVVHQTGAPAEHVTSTQAMPPSARASLAPSMVPEAPRYDPKELEEEVDLPIERRRQVLDLYYRMSELDHYEALGVSYHADKKEIRSAYFALSKAFHPDSMFRKNLGSFKPKMVAVFQLLTEAYETLGKKKSRDEYDAYLRTTKAARMAERALHFAPAEPVPLVVPPAPTVPQINETPAPQREPLAVSPPPDAPPPASPPPAREISQEARRLAQEVISRRLRGLAPPPARPASPVTQGPMPLPTSPFPEAPNGATSTSTEAPARTDTQDLLRRLTRTLRDAGQLTGSNDTVTRAMRASQAALERGDLSEATQQAARAASLAPDRPELKAQHTKLSAQLSEKLANTYIEQARFEMKHGKWASAALTWTKVCEGRPTDAPAHRYAAQALLKAGGDMRGAQRYAQKAVFLAPSDIESRVLLAQICLTVGLKLNARRELEAAAKLDPAHEMVKNLLADLDKG